MAISFLGHKSNGHRLVVDHINNIPSDNRLENLQIITHRKNSSKDRKGGSSKFVGVYWDKQMSKWRARIYLKGKSKHLGLFDSEKEAANAYQLVLTNIK